MEDIVPVIAYCNRNWKIPVYFYNHADFRFSFGYTVSDAVLNLCEFDMDKTIRYRGINVNRNFYLQFPDQGRIEKKRKRLDKKILRKEIEQKYGVKENEKLIISMGEDFKYKSIIGFEFERYVNEVLKLSKAESSFLVIGADRQSEKWIRLEKETSGKGRALGILPRDEAEQLISAADIYIVSFPMAASGISEAEHASVPFLYLDILGRENIEKNDIRFAESIEELVRKTLDVLNGNGDKYLSMQNTNTWTKQEWKRKWKRICDSVTKHELNLFYPKRHIEKQEYVNCQLMQDQASQKIYDYMKHNFLNENMIEEIYRLDRKYDMGISFRHMDYLQKEFRELKKQSAYNLELSEKHLGLYLTALEWLKIKRKKVKIDEYLYNQGYRTVAIYGMSYMGQSLIEELTGGQLKILYGIDKNTDQFCLEIPIFKPSDRLKEVDIIINTTMVSASELTEAMTVKNIEMIGLNDLLHMMNIDKEAK